MLLLLLVQGPHFANHQSVVWQWRWRGENRLDCISEVGKEGPGNWVNGASIDQNGNEESLFALVMIWGEDVWTWSA